MFKTKILPVLIFLAGFFLCWIFFVPKSSNSSQTVLKGLSNTSAIKNNYAFAPLASQSISLETPNFFNKTYHTVQPDIEFDFSWLLKSSLENTKLLILGENHYSSVTHRIRDSLFFYLNTKSYFPLLLLELPLSYTPYIRKYLSLKDDNVAETFLTKYNFMFSFEEDLRLVQKIRAWNKINPLKQLTLGCTDLEHDMEKTLERLIWPWFEKKLKKNKKKLIAEWSKILGTSFLNKIFSLKKDFLQSLLFQVNNFSASQQKISEDFISAGTFISPDEDFISLDKDFISPDEIADILENMLSTLKAQNFEFTYYRQKGIIRNLTKGSILNNPLATSKAFFHAGSYHGTTKLDYPDKGDFFREGSFFQFTFKPTAGKCRSIWIKTIFRYLGKNMKDRALYSCWHTGAYYQSLVNRFQTGVKQGLISLDTLLTDAQINNFTSCLYLTGLKHDSKPYLIKEMNSISKWCKMTGTEARILDCYDYYIVVPKSKLTQARYKFYSKKK